MTRPKSLQVHVSIEPAERARSAAERRDISMSEWIRYLLQKACGEDDLEAGLSAWVKRLNRQSVFTMVGVDALLAGHADHAKVPLTRGKLARFDHALLKPGIAGQCASCHAKRKDQLH